MRSGGIQNAHLLDSRIGRLALAGGVSVYEAHVGKGLTNTIDAIRSFKACNSCQIVNLPPGRTSSIAVVEKS